MELCIARKCREGNVEFLDYALSDTDNKLLVFSKFKEASEFLKSVVGNGEELLNYNITTLEARKDDPRFHAAVSNGKSYQGTQSEEVSKAEVTPMDVELPSTDTSEVEIAFFLDCADFEVSNHDSLIQKSTGKHMAPCIVFVDINDQSAGAQEVKQWSLKAVYVGESQN